MFIIKLLLLSKITLKIINNFRYLSVGTNFVALQYEFLLGRSTIGNIVRETCQILWKILQVEEMPEPNPDQWLDIANKFYLKTDFPNCIGAGKLKTKYFILSYSLNITIIFYLKLTGNIFDVLNQLILDQCSTTTKSIFLLY